MDCGLKNKSICEYALIVMINNMFKWTLQRVPFQYSNDSYIPGMILLITSNELDEHMVNSSNLMLWEQRFICRYCIDCYCTMII